MQTVQGFGIDIKEGLVYYQCPTCKPNTPYDMGSVQELTHIADVNNDGLADVMGLQLTCPKDDCNTHVGIPYEHNPRFVWGQQLKKIFEEKEKMFRRVSINFTGLNVLIEGSSDYLDDSFSLTSDAATDKKFKICFAINESDDYDLYVSTQLQDDMSDWGTLPEGWKELDCIMLGVIKAGASNIVSDDVKHILDTSKVIGLV